MSSNQSGAEKDNRLLFQEQSTLLFSKSKMATTNFRQSGAKLRIQDGSAHESRPCWKTVHQPRRRTGSVSQISMATQITQKNVTQLKNLILTVSGGPKRQRSIRQVTMIKTERLGSDCSLDRVLQSITGQ